MIYVAIVTAPDGNVLRYSQHHEAQQALDWIAAELTGPEEDPGIAGDVVAAEWERCKRSAAYWRTNPELYFSVRKGLDAERYGLVQVRG